MADANLIQHTSGEDGVLELKLAFGNPDNAFTPEAFQALQATLERYTADDSVRSVLLTSTASGFFSNGLSPAAVMNKSESEIAGLIDYFFNCLHLLYFFPAPVITAMNGHAFGYGSMLAIVSDYRYIADKGARMSFPEVNLGVGLPAFVAMVLTDLVGAVVARDLLLTGKAVKGGEAVDIKLADHALPADDVEVKALAHARKLAKASRHAVRSIKAATRYRYATIADKLKADDIADTLAVITSPDAKEGFAALTEKRRPKFA
jgi:enoyl-CoA hydratase/carnithine racemase